jgi:signal transduction histidine kinase
MVNVTGFNKSRKFFDRLDHFANPLDLGPEERSRRRLTGLLVIITAPTLFSFSIVRFLAGDYLLGFFLQSLCIIVTASMVLGRRLKDATVLFRINMALAGLLLLYLVGTSGAHPPRIFWAFIFPIEAFYLLSRKDGILYTFIFYLLSMLLIISQDLFNESLHQDTTFKVAFLVSLLIISLISYSFEVIRSNYEQGIKERQVSLEEEKSKLSKANLILRQEIVERERAENNLKQALQDLTSTQAQLIQSGKMASIGELAAGVAHELNQPLMVIRSNAQLLTRTLKDNPSETEKLGNIELIERNTKRMMKIITHLRSFSRQSKAKLEPVDVNTIVENCFLMMGEQLRLRNIEVSKELTQNLPTVTGDPTQLEQVFLNLITNARDAMAEKGEHEGEGYRGALEITSRVADDGTRSSSAPIEVLVKDTGTGILTEHRDRVFDPFFTTKEVGKGTGLGLSISYGIVRDHGGEIEVVHTGPEGTTFRVLLPRAVQGK